MQRLRTITVVLLVLLGIGGLVGGVAFVTDSSGGRLGMTVDQLPAWPLLDDYLLPGIALLLLFGVLPLVAAWLLVRRSPGGWLLTMAIGLVLVVWMAVQIVAIGFAFPAMQAALLIVGIVLTGLGVDGRTQAAADEYRRARRSDEHGDENAGPDPTNDRGGPDRGRGAGRPADRSDSVR